jgi:hypothetical protein
MDDPVSLNAVIHKSAGLVNPYTATAAAVAAAAAAGPAGCPCMTQTPHGACKAS